MIQGYMEDNRCFLETPREHYVEINESYVAIAKSNAYVDLMHLNA